MVVHTSLWPRSSFGERRDAIGKTLHDGWLLVNLLWHNPYLVRGTSPPIASPPEEPSATALGDGLPRRKRCVVSFWWPLWPPSSHPFKPPPEMKRRSRAARNPSAPGPSSCTGRWI